MERDLFVDRGADDDALWEQRGAALIPESVTGHLAVSQALAGEPDPAWAAVVAALDPATLNGETRVDLIRVWDRMAAWVDAQQQRALAAVVEATADTGIDGHLARHEVGLALRLSPGTASDKVRRATELTGRLRDTHTALARGDIHPLQAAAIADALVNHDDQLAAAIQTRVLARAPRQTLAQTRRQLRHAVIAADPRGAAERADAAKAARTIGRAPREDAMTELHAVMTATDADLVWHELTARASAEQNRLRAAGQASPGIDALRLDALVAGGRATPTTRPRAGAAGTATADPPGSRCGSPSTYPPCSGSPRTPPSSPATALPAHIARELAHDAHWIRWTTDPQTGELLDLGRRRYRPSRRLTDYLHATWGHYEWPGCHQPTERCDIDHIRDFRTGGPTTRANTGPRCRQHHNAKTHGRWRYRRDPDGTGHHTSPLGTTYTNQPPWPLHQ